MSKIEWLGRPGTKPESWNMIGGCTPVSAGCVHCYAARQAMRMQSHPRYEGTAEMRNGVACWTGRINLDYDALDKPLSWRSPRTVFPCSMADLFHKDVPFRFVEDVWRRMAVTPRHTYMILTKRSAALLGFYQWYLAGPDFDYYCDNIWQGVTVESQRTADARLADFEATPAAIKFVSCEPALGPIDWSGWEFIDMLIIGGESGHRARPAHVDWFRDALSWCRDNGIAPFFKQHGAWLHGTQIEPIWYKLPKETYPIHRWADGSISYRIGKKAAGHLLDGVEIREWPFEREEV